MTDKESGQVYWWNEVTNETTALGEPKPGSIPAATTVAPPPAPQGQQSGGMMSGLGGVVAEGKHQLSPQSKSTPLQTYLELYPGFAFGVGSSIARNVVGSMFGGGDNTSGGGGGDDDGWDL